MATRRKTGEDYRKEWNEIQQSKKSLKAYVDQRLRKLLILYPNAKIMIEDTEKEFYKSTGIIPCTSKWFDGLSTYGMIGYIEKIEKWSDEQQPVIQKEIDW
jgi:hypothetical protein